MADRVEPLRVLLAAERFGVLATLAARHTGWPFASLTPYALTETGEPILLLSDLAEHTRNVRADPRASLFIADSAARDDPQAGARLTLLGRVEPASDVANARDRYLQRHAAASGLFEMADFHLYVLRLTEARFIGGFGDMGWVDVSALLKT